MDSFDCAAELMEAINHARSNRQWLDNAQGMAPGEKIIAVRIDYLGALIERWISAPS